MEPSRHDPGVRKVGVERRYKISVVIPVRNEARSLPSLLRSLVDQDFPPEDFEILVADGRSEDGTREVVSQFAAAGPVRVALVDNPKIRSGPGRNAGVTESNGDYVVFVDGHCQIPSHTLLRDTILLFESTGADCLCRPQPLLAPSSKRGEEIATVRASTLGHGRDSLIYSLDFSGFVDPASSGASYRSSVFDRVGMYDEEFDACEDVEFNTRVRKAGMKAYTDPRLAVYYEPRRKIPALFQQMSRYGRGRVKLAIKHPDAILLSQFAPLVLLGLLLIGAAAFLVGGMLRVALLLTPVLYAALVAASTLVLARKRGLIFLWSAPLIYAAIHLGLGTGMLVETLAQARSWFKRLAVRRDQPATQP
jgi:succinoglycan biosynthesis protein ExoA